MEVKNQVYRVTYKPSVNNTTNSNSSLEPQIPTIPLPVNLLAQYVHSELGVSRKRGVDFLNLIGPHVSLIDDDSGRILFLDNQQISRSSIYEFLAYFLRGDRKSDDQSTINRPIDATLFLQTLKKAKIPASWLNYVKVVQ